jgi:hypothetical protein
MTRFFFFCVRSDIIYGLFLAYFAYHLGLSHHIGPAIPTSAGLRAATLGANWVQRRSPSQATHVSHLDGVFYLLLHRHKIQGTTV